MDVGIYHNTSNGPSFMSFRALAASDLHWSYVITLSLADHMLKLWITWRTNSQHGEEKKNTHLNMNSLMFFLLYLSDILIGG